MNNISVVFDCINFWGNEIYRTKKGIPIVKLEEGYYSLSDISDIDSDPDRKFKDNCINIVDKFD